MQVQQFVDEGLGNSAHLVISERVGVAALVDPLRYVGPYLDAAARAGVRITQVFETHVHNDFVSGSREVAARTGAQICASAAAGLQFDHRPLRDGDVVLVGDLQFQALETPGHTPEHLSYVVEDRDALDQAPVLFSGGSLLVGAVSRTDLLGPEHTENLAHALYRSLHEKILRLPDEAAVFPTHGAGSFCTAAPGNERATTIGRERGTNLMLQIPSAEAFAIALVQGMPSYPSYFRRMAAINRQGPRLLGGLPALVPLPPPEVAKRLRHDEAVVDLRTVNQYLAGHIPGAYHVELRPAFASWVGWVVPFGRAVIIVSDVPDSHDEAVRQLSNIGYDDLAGYLEGGMSSWETYGLPVARTQTLSVAKVRQRLVRGEPVVVLDVRQDAEWQSGHIPGAVHIEGGALRERAPAVLSKRETIAVHCGHEQRASTGLSILEREGFSDLRLVRGGWGAWERAGLPREARDHSGADASRRD